MLCLALFLSVVASVDSSNILNNQDNNQWYQDGIKLIQQNLKVMPNTNKAKNAIMFLGDGMGITTITAARILDGQLKNQSGEENVLSWEKFPWSALAKTYCLDLQGADSASSATAILNGVKTKDNIVAMDGNVTEGYCSTATEERKVISILSLAELAGMSTGIVSTTRVTHATVACAYAHSPDRHWEDDAGQKDEALDDASECKDIARQLVEYPHGDGIEVIFGGGRRGFIPRNQSDPEYPDKNGTRLDGRNLVHKWLDKHTNSQYVWNKNQFEKIDVEKVDHVMGLFEYSHMQYELDRVNEPSIAEMTEKAIKILQRNPKGYFLLVEGGRIDHGHHANWAVRALHETVAMNKAVAKAVEITDKDETLITVTADHSHVFTIGAYPKRGNPIFQTVRGLDGDLAFGSDNKTYTSLGYANREGATDGARQDLRGVDTTDKDYKQQATVPRDSETHGSEDVGVFADGPGAYLFHGVFEQQYVFHVMDHALCLSSSKQKSCDKHVKRGGRVKSAAHISSHQSVILLLITGCWKLLIIRG